MVTRRTVFAVALAGLMVAALVPAASAGTLEVDITFRAAPAGMVVPSLHWTTNWLVDETTPAVWVHDPAQDDSLNDRDGVAGCHLTVQDGNDDNVIDGWEALDRAEAVGCISGYETQFFEGQGHMVVSVDGREEVGWPVTWWGIQIDGHMADVGIDGMDLEDGQSLGFVYYVGP